MTTITISEGDIAQLDPDVCQYGALIGVVCDVDEIGITVNVYIPDSQSRQPSIRKFKAQHGTYLIVGRAKWIGVGILNDPDEPILTSHTNPIDS